MRVIAGSAKGQKLLPVPGDTTRPILDRVKTALFDVLRPELPDSSFLDLFAGSGSVGIEALSQGAGACVLVDKSGEAVKTIRTNLARTHLTERAQVMRQDAFAFLAQCRTAFDYIYVAPPQYHGIWKKALSALAERPEILAPRATIIVQIDPKEYEVLEFAAMQQQQERKYGNTLLLFFRSGST